jgi:hypothetical protein
MHDSKPNQGRNALEILIIFLASTNYLSTCLPLARYWQ